MRHEKYLALQLVEHVHNQTENAEAVLHNWWFTLVRWTRMF